MKSQANKDNFVALHDRAWQKMKATQPICAPADEKKPVVVYNNEPVKNRRLTIDSLVRPEPVVIPQKDPQPEIRPYSQDRPDLTIEPRIQSRPKPQPEPRTEPKLEQIPEPVPEVAPVPSVKKIPVPFFGADLEVVVPSDVPFGLSDLSERQLDCAWSLCHDKLSLTLAECQRLKKELKLCDWAYLTFLDKFTTAWLGQGNVATLMMGYLFQASGYKMCLAKQDNNLFVLYTSERFIFNKKSVVSYSGKYYAWNKELPESMDLIQLSSEGSKDIRLDLDEGQAFVQDLSIPRELSSTYGVAVSVRVNKNLIDFYNGYPQSFSSSDILSRWRLYADTPLDEICRNDLYPKLREMMRGTCSAENVRVLLNFVQTAFKYEYDDKVWGYDRPFFAEESLYYEYCDCEDRSILFSRLVRDILGLDVVLVYYPGHLATAVRLDGETDGDYFDLPDGKYTVCDPTYIGAPVGATMPGMNTDRAKVILLKK